MTAQQRTRPKATKKMNGEGSIVERRKGGKVVGYQGSLTIGYDQKGKLKRRFVSGKTKTEVQAELDRLKAERHSGLLSPNEQLTVAALCERWLNQREQAGDLKPTTLRSYRDTVRLYITHTIGKRKLEALTAMHVQGMLDQLREEGRTPQIRRYSLSVLKMALTQALRWNLVGRSVAAGIKPPKVTRPEMRVLTEQEVVRFLEAAKPHRLYVAFLLAVMTGMRRGEILGLKWSDINFEQGFLTVTHNLVDNRGRAILGTPKTEKSRRRLYLAPEVIGALRDHQLSQQAAAARAGEAWQGQNFVCASEVGTHTDPRNFERMFAVVLGHSKVSRVRFHDLRHTAASLMFRKGLTAKTVSETLGHTSVAFTLDRYTHLYDDQRQGAALSFSDFAKEEGPTPVAAPLLHGPPPTVLN